MLGSAHAYESPIEKRFAREWAGCTRFAGLTSEVSGGVTPGLALYFQGEQVRMLNWSAETASEYIRRKYYFLGSTPRLVVEIIHSKIDSNGQERAIPPEFVSEKRYRLDVAAPTKLQKKFLDHAKWLIDDFRENKSAFHRGSGQDE